MAGIFDGLTNLISSILEIFQGILSTILSAFQSVFSIIQNLLSSIIGLFQNLISSVFDLMSGAVGFVLGNIVIIGVLVAAYVGYSAYTQKNRGGGITGGKKRA